jgi:hypothetical protein
MDVCRTFCFTKSVDHGDSAWRGEAVGVLELAVYAVSQVAIAAIILSLAAWRYSSERMALGR